MQGRQRKVDSSLTLGKPFERLRFDGRPPQPLAPHHQPGPAGGYNGTSRCSWTFVVGRNHDDPEDECDEWEDDREWERDD